MKKFYLHNGTDQQGPFDMEDLKARNITKETSIWFEGLQAWTSADKIDELKELFHKKTPPPFQKTPVQPSTQYEPSATQHKNTLGLVLQSIGIIGVIAIIVIFIIANRMEHVQGAANIDTQSYQEKVLPVL